MALYDETWEDGNGRVYRRYTVRKCGSQGFAPFDKLRQLFLFNPPYGFARADAWEWLKTEPITS